MSMEKETVYREELIRICRKLEERGLIAAADGNVSCRLEGERLLITPSGVPKGELRPLDLLVTDLQGKVLRGQSKASSEIRMHLAAYEKRPDIHAVVHAHPPLLTAFTVAGIPFGADVLPEVWLTIGAVPTAAYATPSTPEVPDSIEPFFAGHQAILLERHGSLTLGRTLQEAYLRLEKLEHAAHTLFYSYLLGQRMPSPLSESALAKLGQLVPGPFPKL